MSRSVPVAPAKLLSGLDLPGGWKVIKPLSSLPGSTGGCFSVGYIVQDEAGDEAFMKALDYSAALNSPDPARMLQAMTEAYNFERDVLQKCRDRKLTRVVRAIADGNVQVSTGAGPQVVQYLIFEKADADSRNFINTSKAFDIAWALRSLHHITIGLRQMHANDMAHQDVKPSNVLVFNNDSSKISDVGRAAYKGHSPPHETLSCPGDPTYAPPEVLFNHREADWGPRRLACDLYLLGSMVSFFFSGVAATPATLSRLLPQHHPRAWAGTYGQVLPYVRDAFNKMADDFEQTLDSRLRPDLSVIFRQLCDSDPNLRGHPRDRASVSNAFSLERYVSAFDLLASKAERGLL
jgi:eukaryotic-like serine/threonine-protein kinase